MKFHTFLVTLQNSKNTTQKQEKKFRTCLYHPHDFSKIPHPSCIVGKKKNLNGNNFGHKFH